LLCHGLAGNASLGRCHHTNRQQHQDLI
jgi:hypothetical protein